MALKALKKHWELNDVYPYGVFVDGVPALYAPFGEYEEWMTQKAFRYISCEGWVVRVPKHCKTDLASLPRWLRIIFGVNRRESIPAVIHDFGYRNNKKALRNVFTDERCVLSRAEWDKMFFDLMIFSKTAPVRRYMFYHGVRLGGGFHKNWRKK